MATIDAFPADDLLAREIAEFLPGSFRFNDRKRSFSHSVHSVLSGVLDASEVVIKPFRGSVARGADHEASMLDMIGRLDIPTLTPVFLCFAPLADYVVTKYEQIEPLDQMRLKHCPADQLRNIAGEVGGLITRLHEGGIVHKDLQPKNIFRHMSGGPLGVLDPEYAEHHKDTSSNDFLGGCSKDLAIALKEFGREVGFNNAPSFTEGVLDVYARDERPGLTQVLEGLPG